jgi:tRNA (adenine57-N1/adenine58-N1)-methyltransferase
VPGPPPWASPQGGGRELKAGELVLLHDRAGRRYRLRLEPGETHSLHTGSLRHDELIGRPEGTLISTTSGSTLLALRPTFAETVVDRRRQAQPIYPKDLGAILVGADVQPRARVLEAGTGTGGLTLALLRAVGDGGQVISYELRNDFHDSAQRMLEETLGRLPSNLELRLADVYEGVPERDLDRGLLDLPEPWRAVPAVKDSLRPGGILFAHCPNISQAQQFIEALREAGGFGLFETVEVLQRGWTIRGRSLRPAHRMVAHTGFLTFARRLAGDTVFEAEKEGF